MSAPDTETLLATVLPNAVPQLALAVLIWLLAPWLATRLVREDGGITPQHGLRASRLLSVGLIVLGVSLAAHAAAELSNLGVQSWLERNREAAQPSLDARRARYHLPGQVVRLIIGVLLIGSGGLRDWLGGRLAHGDETANQPVV